MQRGPGTDVIRYVNQNLASRTPWKAILSVVMAVLYGASPIDLIPDIIPFLGQMDDAVIVPLLLVMAMVQYRKSRKLRPGRPIIHMPPR